MLCYSNSLTKIEMFLEMFVFLGDVLSSEAGNSIPLLAIIYAALSSMNSVGVSVYQEQLFKVNTQPAMTMVSIESIFLAS